MDELRRKLDEFENRTGKKISIITACILMGIDRYWIYCPDRYTGKQDIVKKAVKKLNLFSYLPKERCLV